MTDDVKKPAEAVPQTEKTKRTYTVVRTGGVAHERKFYKKGESIELEPESLIAQALVNTSSIKEADNA